MFDETRSNHLLTSKDYQAERATVSRRGYSTLQAYPLHPPNLILPCVSLSIEVLPSNAIYLKLVREVREPLQAMPPRRLSPQERTVRRPSYRFLSRTPRLRRQMPRRAVSELVCVSASYRHATLLTAYAAEHVDPSPPILLAS